MPKREEITAPSTNRIAGIDKAATIEKVSSRERSLIHKMGKERVQMITVPRDKKL